MLKSAIIYFAGRVGAALIVLLSTSVYTRLLSPAEYGVYALIVSGVTMAYAQSCSAASRICALGLARS
jgi:O-antigen/teichoic acid export membrane protein